MKIVRLLASVFFVVAIVVHIHGLIYHPTTESDVSHVVHLVSYAVCLVSLRLRSKHLLWLILGSVYPVYYHAKCAFSADFSPNVVCIFTVALMTSVIAVYAFERYKSP